MRQPQGSTLLSPAQPQLPGMMSWFLLQGCCEGNPLGAGLSPAMVALSQSSSPHPSQNQGHSFGVGSAPWLWQEWSYRGMTVAVGNGTKLCHGQEHPQGYRNFIC